MGPAGGRLLVLDRQPVDHEGSAENVANAYKFIEYLLQPEVAAKMCEESGIAVPNTPMMELLPEEIANNPAMFVPAEDMARADVILDPEGATQAYQEGWTKVRAE